MRKSVLLFFLFFLHFVLASCGPDEIPPSSEAHSPLASSEPIGPQAIPTDRELERARNATDVIWGVVDDVRVAPCGAEAGVVCTTAQLEVRASLRGLTGTVQVRSFGGESDDGAVLISGEPRFHLGDVAVAFLRAWPEYNLHTVVDGDAGYLTARSGELPNGLTPDNYLLRLREALQ